MPNSVKPVLRTTVERWAWGRLPSTVALFGVLLSWYAFHWDIAWHVDIGRDRFLSVPHLLVIAGYWMSGGAGLAGLMLTRLSLRDAWKQRPGLVLVAVSAGFALVTLVFDNWWHAAFGRDSTIWSPPHLLLVFVPIVGVIGALLDRRRLGLTGAWVVGAAAILLASLGALLSEYEYGYPHFRTTWWAPTLALLSGFVLVLTRSASRLRWAATLVGVATLGLRLAALVANEILGRSLPVLPVPILVAAVAVDLLAVGTQRGALKRVVVAAIAWVPTYVAFEVWYGSVGLVDLPSSSWVTALTLSILTWLAGVALGRFVGERLAAQGWAGESETVAARSPLRRPGGLIVVAVLITLLFAASAVPQFDDVGDQVAATVALEGNRVILTVPTAGPGDVVTVLGPRERGCRPQECVKAGGRQWLGRLQQRQPGRFEGSPRAYGDWLALWYVGGDHVWLTVVDRGESGPVQLQNLVPARSAPTPSGVAISAAVVFGLMMIALWATAAGLEAPQRRPDAGRRRGAARSSA